MKYLYQITLNVLSDKPHEDSVLLDFEEFVDGSPFDGDASIEGMGETVYD